MLFSIWVPNCSANILILYQFPKWRFREKKILNVFYRITCGKIVAAYPMKKIIGPPLLVDVDTMKRDIKPLPALHQHPSPEL